MGVDKGNWFSNQKEVSEKVQNLDSDGNLTGQTFGTATTYIADGAIALTDTVATLSGAGATANMTLANGTEGQVIYIGCINSANAVTVTLATAPSPGVDVATFTSGDGITVAFDGVRWFITGNQGAVLS